MFRDIDRQLTKQEYERLLKATINNGNMRLALVMETIASTGIRISELSYITVEAVQVGRTDIWLKGKIRTILLPEKLCLKLKAYIKEYHL